MYQPSSDGLDKYESEDRNTNAMVRIRQAPVGPYGEEP